MTYYSAIHSFLSELSNHWKAADLRRVIRLYGKRPTLSSFYFLLIDLSIDFDLVEIAALDWNSLADIHVFVDAGEDVVYLRLRPDNDQSHSFSLGTNPERADLAPITSIPRRAILARSIGSDLARRLDSLQSRTLHYYDPIRPGEEMRLSYFDGSLANRIGTPESVNKQEKQSRLGSSNRLIELHAKLFDGKDPFGYGYRHRNISKNGVLFADHRLLESECSGLLVSVDQTISSGAVIDKVWMLASALSNLIALHPFREGNWRVIRIYIEEIGARIGVKIDTLAIKRAALLEALRKSVLGDPAHLLSLLSKHCEL